MYEMTRDGWIFLVMGFTGVKAAKVKEQYIAAFNAMEDHLWRSLARTNVAEIAIASLSQAVESLVEVTKETRVDVYDTKQVVGQINGHITGMNAQINGSFRT